MHTSFDIYDAFLLGSTLITNIPAKQEYRLEEIGNQAKPIIMLLHIQYFFGQIVSILIVKMIFTMNQEYESLDIREFQCILILTGELKCQQTNSVTTKLIVRINYWVDNGTHRIVVHEDLSKSSNGCHTRTYHYTIFWLLFYRTILKLLW